MIDVRTADHIDHTYEATVPEGQTSLLVGGRPDGRLFVSVAPHRCSGPTHGPLDTAAARLAAADGLPADFHCHGGIDAYLTGPAGVSAADPQVLRRCLVGPGA